MKANCTVHFTNGKLRGELYRALHPEYLEWITVNFPIEELRNHFPGTPIQEVVPDPNGEYRLRLPTDAIEPDEDVEYIPFYYMIGDSRDAAPFGLDMFKWYENKETINEQGK